MKYGIALCLLLFINIAVAQYQPDISKKSSDVITLESEMLEVRYNAQPTEDLKKQLLFNYEELLSRHCTSGEALPSGMSERCQKIIDKTLKIDAANLSAICSRDGYNSESCREAYEKNSDHKNETPYERLKHLLDKPPEATNSKKELSKQAKINALSKDLVNARAEHRKKNSQVTKAKLVSIYEELMHLTCQQPTGGTETNQPPECFAHIQQTLVLDPENSAVKCYRDGACGNRRPAANVEQGTTSQGGGLVEF